MTTLNPFTTTPQRIPSFPDVARTTALRLGNTAVVSTGSNPSMRFLLLRSPTLPVWADSSNPIIVVAKAAYDGVTGLPLILPSLNVLGSYAETSPLSISYVPSGATPNPTPYLVRDETVGPSSYVPMFWFMNISVILFNGFADGVPGANWTTDISGTRLRVEWLLTSGETAETTHSVSAGGTLTTNSVCFTVVPTNTNVIGMRPLRVDGGGAVHPTMYPGLLRVVSHNFSGVVITPGTGSGVTTMALSGATYVLQPMFSPPGISQSLLPYLNSRLTSLGIKVRNTTKVMNKEGTWLAARVSARGINPFNIDLNAAYSSLNVLDRITGPLESTLTMALPPSTKLMDFEDHIMSSASVSTANAQWSTTDAVILQVANLTQFSIATAFDPDTTTPSTLTVDAAWHLEFRHTGILWPLQVCKQTLEQYHKLAIAAVERPPARFGSDSQTLLTGPSRPATRAARASQPSSEKKKKNEVKKPPPKKQAQQRQPKGGKDNKKAASK